MSEKRPSHLDKPENSSHVNEGERPSVFSAPSASHDSKDSPVDIPPTDSFLQDPLSTLNPPPSVHWKDDGNKGDPPITTSDAPSSAPGGYVVTTADASHLAYDHSENATYPTGAPPADSSNSPYNSTADVPYPADAPHSVYDPAEDWYANSATQSYLHDSYYPHLYYEDWHETQYDEMDRSQDYYNDQAYDAQDAYHSDYYRDQEEYREQTYYSQDYDHAPHFSYRSEPSGTNSTFAPSALAAGGILAAGEAYAHAKEDHSSYEVKIPSEQNTSQAPEYLVPHLEQAVSQASEHHGSGPFPASDVPYSDNRLMVNRVDESLSSALSGTSMADSRLIINRVSESPFPSEENPALPVETSDQSAAAYASFSQAQEALNPSSDTPLSETRLMVNRVSGSHDYLEDDTPAPASLLTSEQRAEATFIDTNTGPRDAERPLMGAVSHETHVPVSAHSQPTSERLETLLTSASEPPGNRASESFGAEGQTVLNVPEGFRVGDSQEAASTLFLDERALNQESTQSTYSMKRGHGAPRALDRETLATAESFLMDPNARSEQASTFLSDSETTRIENTSKDILSENSQESLLTQDASIVGESGPDPASAHSSASERLSFSERSSASEHSETAKDKVKLAGWAALGLISGVGKAAGHAVMGSASKLTTIAAREDEDVRKVDDARLAISDAVREGQATHQKRKQRTQSLKRLQEDLGLMKGTKVQAESAISVGSGDKSITNIKDASTQATSQVRERATAVDAKRLNDKLKTEKADKAKRVLLSTGTAEVVLTEKDTMIEKGPTGAKKEALKAAEKKDVDAKAVLLDKKGDKKGALNGTLADDEKGILNNRLTDAKKGDLKSKTEKKPVTKRERDRAAKLKKMKDLKGKDAVSMTALKPVKSVGSKVADKVGTGALVAKNLATSSLTNTLSKENEDVATLMSMKGYANKAATIVRMPIRVARAVANVIRFIKNIVSGIVHGLAALGSLGWVIGGVLLLVLIIFVVVIMSGLAIINENQETSEVAALVAQLDAELEEEIQSYGGTIHYADARGSYLRPDPDHPDETTTRNFDMSNDKTSLDAVSASTVEVFTNPDEICAYIDAKYEGEWQVGAASWKYSVEWNGKKYNIFDWEKVPEWVQKGLNKLDRENFRGRIQEIVRDYLFDEVFEGEDFGPRDAETQIVENIAEDVADELAKVIYDEQMQGINDEIIYETVKVAIEDHGKDHIKITDDQLKKLNYTLMEEFSDAVGEAEPVALVYDEIVELHEYLNYWSENYIEIEAGQVPSVGGPGSDGGDGSGTDNAYGYPNSSGYNEKELEKWDGYNEISIYGVGESTTPSAVTADGTNITGTWSDKNMAIACEGLQNELFAYWSSDYKAKYGDTDPVKITLYNAATGQTVTAEVRDCGGWRGYIKAYEGQNQDRQWDVLPAVWKALGGGVSAGTMKVYWKVDPESSVSAAGMAPLQKVSHEGYVWTVELDNDDGVITLNRATYIRHDISDLFWNDELLDEMIGRDNYGSDAQFEAVKTWVKMKLEDIMVPVLTAKNKDGDEYTDYFLTRRELGNPFGKADGKEVEWVVTKQFNPGFQDDFDKEERAVYVKPLSGKGNVYAVRKGTVTAVGENYVRIKTSSETSDNLTSDRMTYTKLSDIQVEVGDEVKQGQRLGKLKDEDGTLGIAWYEVYTYIGVGDKSRSWAYCPSLFMSGFAGYVEPDFPTKVAEGAAISLENCESVVDFARSRLGCPYVWGATGPSEFDCSGLTQWCYKKAGIDIPRNSDAQHDAGTIIPLSEAKPGDILWKSGHVGIYVSGDTYIHAPKPGDVVKVSKGIDYFTCALRFGS